MSKFTSRRAVLIGGASLGGLLLARGAAEVSGPTLDRLYRVGEAMSRRSHRLLLARQPLAREFSAAEISGDFPVIGTAMPETARYARLLDGGFADWRLAVDGLVERPMTLSLAELQRLPSRTQVTAHSCERGWTAIAQWTGVQLSRVLELAGPRPEARWVVIHCEDGWWDSYSLDAFEALHPQTILAYSMNGGALPIAHGAPVRLRVERQLGWKSLKFVNRVQLVDDYRKVGEGKGSLVAEWGFQWYGGI